MGFMDMFKNLKEGDILIPKQSSFVARAGVKIVKILSNDYSQDGHPIDFMDDVYVEAEDGKRFYARIGEFRHPRGHEKYLQVK